PKITEIPTPRNESPKKKERSDSWKNLELSKAKELMTELDSMIDEIDDSPHTTKKMDQHQEPTGEQKIEYLHQMKAEHHCEARNQGELSFKKGDIITVFSKDDSGWWKGSLGGVQGLFPSNFTSVHRIVSPRTIKLSKKVSSKVLELQQSCGFLGEPKTYKN